MQWVLIFFGWTFLIAMFVAIFLPYLRRRSDLLTSWNLFLLGSANFVGFAAVQTGNAERTYGYYIPEDYISFISGAILFYFVIFLAYYLLPLPRRWASRRLRKWPSASTPTLLALLPLCWVLGLFSVFTPNVQGVGQILVIAGTATSIFAAVYTLTAWTRQRHNLVLLGLVVASVVFAAIVAIHGTTGRRFFLSVAMSFLIVGYWGFFRYRGSIGGIVKASIVGLLVFAVIAAYSTIRGRKTGAQGIEYAIESLQLLPSALLGLRTDAQGDTLLGGDAVDASLAAINHYRENADPQPFHTIIFVASNPIPRAFWENKPEALGYTLPRDVGVWRRTGFVNLGPGIIGHGFHEGGWHMLVFYAILFGYGFRLFDFILARQPDNPYFLALFAAISGQLVAFARGDIGLFLVLMLGAVATTWLLSFVLRLFFGTHLYYPTLDEQAAQPLDPLAYPTSFRERPAA